MLGWSFVVIGAVAAIPSAILFGLVTHVIPLAAVLPPTMRADGPVRATLPAVLSVGIVFAVAAAVFAQGVHRVARGRWNARLLVGTLAAGALLVAAGARVA